MIDAPPVQLLDKLHEAAPDDRTQPLHVLVRAGLNDLIERHFEDGQRFWSESVLSERLNISRVTVRRALLDLSTEGTLKRFRAKGTFVRKPARARTTPGIGAEVATSLKSVGVFVPKYSSQFYTGMLNALARQCDGRALTMHLYHTHQGERGEQAARQLQIAPEKEALILLGTAPQLTRELSLEIEAAGYRSVTVDVLIPDHPAAYVGTNNDMGIRLGLRHLIDLGHRRVTLLVNEPAELKVIQTRCDAFRSVVQEQEALAEARVVTAGLKLWEDPYEATFGCMERIWNGGGDPRPTALFCVSDVGAWAALKWLAERKIQVPSEVSVMGFDDDEPSRFTRPGLTTVAHPRDEVARRAVELLLCTGEPHEFLPPHLVVRGSTGVPCC